MADPVTPDPNSLPKIGGDPSPSGDGLILGKYKTPDDLAKAHQEAQAALTKAQQELAELKKPKGDPAPTPAPKDDAVLSLSAAADVDEGVEEAIARAGLNLEAVVKQFAEHGKLTDEQYAALKTKAGLKPKMVNQIAASMAQATQYREQSVASVRNAIFGDAGGEDKFAVVAAAAQGFLSKDEQAEYDRRLGDPRTAMSAWKDLKARYAVHVGESGSKPIIGGGTPSSGTRRLNTQDDLRNLLKNGKESDYASVPLSEFTQFIRNI